MRKVIAAAALAAALLVAPDLRAQRSLRWTSVEVDARLEADGRLRVQERQSYVFDGDWNGGERTFRLESGQELELHSVSRVDPTTGAEMPLERGGLERVDQYDFTDSKTLRWRSRLPEDPPFEGERITYVLDYTLANILVRRGEGYLLDHEFLFSDRAGPIERFTLDLDIDEAWRADEPKVHREITDVGPGEKALVRIPLEYVGVGAPAARPDRTPRRVAVLGLIAAGALLAWIAFASRENRLGRFDPLPRIDRGWIEQHLLPIRAETVGAAWDGEVKQSEVAALLARLVAEKKVETETVGEPDKPELRMDLKVPREQFSGYERALVDGFFFEGDSTGTAAIREHYESSGFDPVALIKGDVTREADALLPGEKSRGIAGCVGTLFFFVLLGFAIFMMPEERRVVGFVAGGVSFVLFAIACSIGKRWESRPDFGRRHALWMLVPWALLLLAVAGVSMAEPPLVAEVLFAAAAVAGIATSAGVASSKQSRTAIEFRRKLAAVRSFFMEELARPAPALEDAWFPYVLAFGLAKQAESWFQAFGGASRGAGAIVHSTSSSSSSGSQGSGWSGGGGSFGGAGASGTWVAAATGVAAGVAAPSSSSSGGGGGGGGSSGGGGGGGW